MANQFTYQVIKDTTQHTVIKLTGKFDGSGQEDNAARIQASSLSGALNTTGGLLIEGGTPKSYYGLAIHRLWYDCTNPNSADVEVYWNATTPVTSLMLSGTFEYDGNGNWVTIPNSAAGTPGCNGSLGIKTRGMVANNSYSIVVELRKDNSTYQRGQFNDPAAFNYGEYGMVQTGRTS
jgi:hypothetical protein